MREILFKGKCKRTDKWVFGSLILPNTENENTYIQDNTGVSIKVNNETVSQFTGLTDKNGVKIFEGDKLLYDGVEGIVYYENSSFFVKFEYLRSSHLLGELERDLEIIGSILDI